MQNKLAHKEKKLSLFKKINHKILFLFRLNHHPVVSVYRGYGNSEKIIAFGHVLKLSPMPRKTYRKNWIVNFFSMLRLFMVKPFVRAKVYSAALQGCRQRGCSLQALEKQLIGAAPPRRRAGLRDSGALLPVRAQRRRAPARGGARAQPPRSADAGRAHRAAAAHDAQRSGRDRATRAKRSRSATSTRAAGSRRAARASFRRAIDRCRSPRGAYDPIRIDALRALALTCRRARQHDEAAACWRELVEMRGCPPPIAREATEALAIHHEHRVRDLAAAKRSRSEAWRRSRRAAAVAGAGGPASPGAARAQDRAAQSEVSTTS